jgi:hypothetical protein
MLLGVNPDVVVMDRSLWLVQNLTIRSHTLKSLKSLSVPVSLVCLGSLSFASAAIVTAPYFISDARSGIAQPTVQPTECRTLFAAVVDAQEVRQGFYTRKAANIQALRLSEVKVQSLQSRFVAVFGGLESAQRQGNSEVNRRLGRQVTQLVGELNRYCFR